MAAVAGKTESRTARFRAMAGVTGQGKDQGAEGHAGLRLERKETTRGLRQRRPSSKPFAASAIAPGPFRGWGRKPLACIHTQREPDVSPAGTGTEYPRPKGPPHASRGSKASGSPS
ncbi:MAG: hypothetical protein AMXMBFR76_10050 [Pseudomonadota bacterium]